MTTRLKMEIIRSKGRAKGGGEICNSSESNIVDKANSDTRNVGEKKIVTALKPAIHNSRRVNVFVDEKFDFSLDLAQIVDYGLKVGQVLSADELEELRHASIFGKLYQRTLEYVLMRPHSIQEVRNHLTKRQRDQDYRTKHYVEHQVRHKAEPYAKHYRGSQANQAAGYPIKPKAEIRDEDIELVIESLIEKGYLDDKKFAKYYIENRNAVKGTSRRKLRLDLLRKGVESKIIDEAMRESTRNDEDEILKIVKKKTKHGYDEQKLIQYLVRQGFDFELAKAVICEKD